MLEQLPFKIYRRTLKTGKSIYYARFLLPDGKYTNGRSTGQTSKRKAEIKAWEYIKTGNPVSSQNQKMKDFAIDFFNWDGEWALSKRSAGKKLSKDQCISNNRVPYSLLNLIMINTYAFPEKIRLT